MRHTVTSTAQKRGMVETVTAAHGSIWRHLYDSMHVVKSRESKLKFVTLGKESNRSTLWKKEEFLEICNREEVSGKAQEIEENLPVPKHQQARCSDNPESFFVDHIWGRQPDGVVFNVKLKRNFCLEFKWSTDREEGFLGVKEAKANEKQNSIITVLRAVVPKWEVEQINFVIGNHGSVTEERKTSLAS